MRRVDVNLDLDLIAPFALKLQFLPRSLNIYLKHMLIGFAYGDCVDWDDLAQDGDHQSGFPRDIWQCRDVETCHKLKQNTK